MYAGDTKKVTEISSKGQQLIKDINELFGQKDGDRSVALEKTIASFKTDKGNSDELQQILNDIFQKRLNTEGTYWSELMVLVRHGADANYMLLNKLLSSTGQPWEHKVVDSLLEQMLDSSGDCVDFISELITKNKVTKENYTTIFSKTEIDSIDVYNPENWISYFMAIAKSADKKTFVDAIKNFLNIEMHKNLAFFYLVSDTSEQNHEAILVQVFNRLNNLDEKPLFLDPVGKFIRDHSSELGEVFNKLCQNHLDKNDNFVLTKPTLLSKFFGSSSSSSSSNTLKTTKEKKDVGIEMMPKR